MTRKDRPAVLKQGTVGNAWRHFCLSQPGVGVGCYLHEARDAAKHPIMNGTALAIKNYLAPNVDSTEFENPETDHVKSMLGDKLSEKTNENCYRKVKISDDFLAF